MRLSHGGPKRSKEEAYFFETPHNVNMLFLGLQVLVLHDNQ